MIERMKERRIVDGAVTEKSPKRKHCTECHVSAPVGSMKAGGRTEHVKQELGSSQQQPAAARRVAGHGPDLAPSDRGRHASLAAAPAGSWSAGDGSLSGDY